MGKKKAASFGEPFKWQGEWWVVDYSMAIQGWYDVLDEFDFVIACAPTIHQAIQEMKHNYKAMSNHVDEMVKEALS